LRCEGGLDMKDSSVADRLRKQVCNFVTYFKSICSLRRSADRRRLVL
jgi:hypothetical protein